MSDTEADLAGLRHLLDHVDLPLDVRGRDFQVCSAGGGQWADTFGSITDATLIARGITALPALLDRLEAAVAKVAQVEAIVTRLAADDPEYDTSYGAAGAMRLLADLRAALADPGDERGQG